jgi:hypothetical protein
MEEDIGLNPCGSHPTGTNCPFCKPVDTADNGPGVPRDDE